MPRWLYPLLLAVPLSLLANALKLPQTLIFILSAIALVPLAGLIATATETLAEHLGERTGGLLNATFGNAAELIIGFVAIAANLQDVVRASIIGSIIGNALLVLGSSMLIGGWRFGIQTFDPRGSGQYASFLLLSVVGLVLPSLVAHIDVSAAPGQQTLSGVPLHELSLAVAVFLLLSYIAYIAFSVFGVHAQPTRDRRGQRAAMPLENPAIPNANAVEMATTPDGARQRRRRRKAEVTTPRRESPHRNKRRDQPADPITSLREFWRTSRWVPVIVLAAATALTAVVADSLVGTIEPLAHSVGLSPFFVGLIILPIIGNAAEHTSAITMAAANRMETAMAITAGSSIQVALLVAPVLVLVSPFLGHVLDLDFSVLELVIFGLIAGLYALVSLDGESTWLEGLQLLAFYLIVATVAIFVPL